MDRGAVDRAVERPSVERPVERPSVELQRLVLKLVVNCRIKQIVAGAGIMFPTEATYHVLFHSALDQLEDPTGLTTPENELTLTFDPLYAVMNLPTRSSGFPLTLFSVLNEPGRKQHLNFQRFTRDLDFKAVTGKTCNGLLGWTVHGLRSANYAPHMTPGVLMMVHQLSSRCAALDEHERAYLRWVLQYWLEAPIDSFLPELRTGHILPRDFAKLATDSPGKPARAGLRLMHCRYFQHYFGTEELPHWGNTHHSHNMCMEVDFFGYLRHNLDLTRRCLNVSHSKEHLKKALKVVLQSRTQLLEPGEILRAICQRLVPEAAFRKALNNVLYLVDRVVGLLQLEQRDRDTEQPVTPGRETEGTPINDRMETEGADGREESREEGRRNKENHPGEDHPGEDHPGEEGDNQRGEGSSELADVCEQLAVFLSKEWIILGQHIDKAVLHTMIALGLYGCGSADPRSVFFNRAFRALFSLEKAHHSEEPDELGGLDIPVVSMSDPVRLALFYRELERRDDLFQVVWPKALEAWPADMNLSLCTELLDSLRNVMTAPSDWATMHREKSRFSFVALGTSTMVLASANLANYLQTIEFIHYRIHSSQPGHWFQDLLNISKQWRTCADTRPPQLGNDQQGRTLQGKALQGKIQPEEAMGEAPDVWANTYQAVWDGFKLTK
ncbi:hypothetical protein GNI_124410 [Gregarina niphandrodes]|uniref:Uncharacterized protein n=1 Tax=Gregarina niphandrodes TaxID=110365 RepID=A0A023B2A9_GRENI|nr:hypothetical protein GNI_124410 [Gregarina niphandrodes]EZG51532.1 hypothetical protein GNI_124410 [Gregarina niphandrodes]|eukprot:XP_011131970.1 hypothetical protein GNI_124410 [Gregarina niphandrodes]